MGRGRGRRLAMGNRFGLMFGGPRRGELGVSKGPVRIQLAPAGGTAATLGQGAGAEEVGGWCERRGGRRRRRRRMRRQRSVAAMLRCRLFPEIAL